MDCRGNSVIRVENTADSPIFAPGTLFAFLFAATSTFESDYRAFVADETIGIRKYLDSVFKLKQLLREYNETVRAK